MKTLVCNQTGLSKYLFEDADAVTVTATHVDTPTARILDMRSGTCTVHLGVTAPGDWFGDRYFFDGDTWTPNPDFVDPQA